MKDDLRPEYDLEDSDVAEVFSNADAVNEALRFLIRIMQQNQDFIPKS